MQEKFSISFASFRAGPVALAFVLMCITRSAWAHGPQLQITNEGGQIVTRSIFLDGPYDTASPIRQVYVIPMGEFNGSWYARPNASLDVLGNPTYFSGPGLAYGLGGTFSANEKFEITFLDGLKRWDGVTFVDAGAAEVQAFRGSPEAPAASAITSDGGPFAALALPPIEPGYDGQAHSSARFRLLGDGLDPLTGSQDGVYLLTLQISSSDASLTSSQPFYFVLYKNAPRSGVLSAIDSLGVPAGRVQFVPEPTTCLLISAASLLFCALGRVGRGVRRW